MDEDPAFYKKFSQMLKETIADYEAKRINEAQYLSKVQEIMNNVLAYTDSDIPGVLREKDVAKAFYGLTIESLSEKIQDDIVKTEIAIQTALQIDELIKQAVLDNYNPIIDWQFKTNITGKLLIEIGDYLIDEVRDKYNINLSFGEMDEIANKWEKFSGAEMKNASHGEAPWIATKPDEIIDYNLAYYRNKYGEMDKD